MTDEAKLLPQYVAGLSAAMGSFALGTVIGWTAPVEPDIKEGSLGFEVSNAEYGWIGSLMALGAACVCIPIGYVINVIGRKWTMLILVPPFVLGWILILLASNVIMLFVARFLLGMCGGAFCIIAPIYTTEIAQTKIRGILGCFFQMLITSGILYVYVVGALTEVMVSSILCALVPVLMALLFLMLPESPAFFVLKGNMEKAQKSLQWLRGKDYDISGEMAQFVANDKYAKENQVSVAKSLVKKSTLLAFAISISLMLFQQLSGINAIVMYSTGIFKDAETGFTDTTCTILVGTMMVVATFISLFFIDRAGRRPLLMLSASFMSFCTFGVGFYFFKKASDEEFAKSIAWLPVLCCCLYVIMFSCGFGAIPWLLMAELFSEDIKGIAGSIAGTTNWLAAFMVTNTYPFVSEAIGIGLTFWIFSALTLLAVFFVLFVVPETKGKTFLEIQTILEGGGA